MRSHTVVEICAGAGGQALGLEGAGFRHLLAVEIDPDASGTLRRNRPGWTVAEGDVSSAAVWNPARYRGVDLLAGGIPCQPYTVAGKQLGAGDERDLLAWTVEHLCGVVRPRALLLENVAGLSQSRFSAYRQYLLDRLAQYGYVAEWRILNACDFGVPQLRPRFILVAMRPETFAHFEWPAGFGAAPSVGETLRELMAAGGWEGAQSWSERADGIGPTLVGGSRRHGGPDLGPTRAREAWARLGVDGTGLADAPPVAGDPLAHIPKLTLRMAAAVQGFPADWSFHGRKTAVYRQIGNAFPPPVAQAVGARIRAALDLKGRPITGGREAPAIHDPVYSVLRAHGGFLTAAQLRRRLSVPMTGSVIARHLDGLGRDFVIEVDTRPTGDAYRLGRLRAFAAQPAEVAGRAHRRRGDRRPAAERAASDGAAPRIA